MAHAIFISYRRDDTEGEAGRLFDDLTRAFGSDAVFMDVAGIEPGTDFRKAIDDNVGFCGVLLGLGASPGHIVAALTPVAVAGGLAVAALSIVGRKAEMNARAV